ncbi:hypothetical protein [Marinobacterium nitratireducens]|uniref:hypothetical protein n=1 Tax=Marinobacterium nitratireducens TaxID=518897 RepID=UPI0016646BEA|nr:hypothetical protein [Marinobacterium nitratireducens]
MALALLAPGAFADQMVIAGNAIRDGDSVSRLIKYAGQPIARGSGTVCLNRDCSRRGSAATWIYLHDDIQYTVSIRNSKIVAIDWKHAN